MPGKRRHGCHVPARYNGLASIWNAAALEDKAPKQPPACVMIDAYVCWPACDGLYKARCTLRLHALRASAGAEGPAASSNVSVSARP